MPNLKECIGNSVCSPSFLACRLSICDICFADNGCDPCTGRPPAALGGGIRLETSILLSYSIKFLNSSEFFNGVCVDYFIELVVSSYWNIE